MEKTELNRREKIASMLLGWDTIFHPRYAKGVTFSVTRMKDSIPAQKHIPITNIYASILPLFMKSHKLI